MFKYDLGHKHQIFLAERIDTHDHEHCRFSIHHQPRGCQDDRLRERILVSECGYQPFHTDCLSMLERATLQFGANEDESKESLRDLCCGFVMRDGEGLNETCCSVFRH